MRRSHPRRLAGLYLAQRTRFGVKFGLETMRALVAELDHPERAYTTLLVSGTNGKGSVVASVEASVAIQKELATRNKGVQDDKKYSRGFL